MKRFNLNQFLWFLILVALLATMGILYFTGDIFLLVSEKVKIYLMITLIVLGIMLLVQVTRIFTVPSRGGIKKGYFLYFILIFSFFVVIKVDILKSSLLMKGVKIEHKTHNHGKGHSHDYLTNNDIVIVGKSDFHKVVEAINEHSNEFENKKIIIEGLAYKELIELGDFVITQIDMNCCMGDSTFLGLTCFGGISDDIETGDYIKINGIIKIFEESNKRIPVIEVDSVDKINR
ncbi:MAG: TIGR03943 family putative permease subunit [Sarcina sp.]